MVLGHAINDISQLLLFTHIIRVITLQHYYPAIDNVSLYTNTLKEREPQGYMLDGAAVNSESLDLYPPEL